MLLQQVRGLWREPKSRQNITWGAVCALALLALSGGQLYVIAAFWLLFSTMFAVFHRVLALRHERHERNQLH